ncbi:polysaccharide lyase family 8 super-sandwich domain-containing protein [Pontiella agarivorans]|uniref:Polysaccharide lyase family 8 super-sandwich domain-containing protein n=1 Tax=Pontiella agarivorans TaxID=3038953 RepID=A0ABU5MY83_9BACT|nr:polysaccharide lyase family 8 super-sandwich domain-containing protein [Pontiella agarivorans]MDZ8119170.1 polysaccharide lyase family 8 super-sandwich domain-containing protein [Pontiella agarivorans]
MNKIWLWSGFIAVLTTLVQGEVVYVDFGPSGDTYSDAAEAYNNFSWPDSDGLVNISGASSGITLHYQNYGGSYSYASGGDRDAVSGISTNVTKDRMYAGTGNFVNVGEFGYTLTFSGLDPAGTCYVGVLPSPTGISSTWKVTTGTGDTTEYIQDDVTRDNLFEWEHITPDTNGTIVLTGRAVSNAKWKSVGLSGIILEVFPARVTVGFSIENGTNGVVNASGLQRSFAYTLESCTNLAEGNWSDSGRWVSSVETNAWTVDPNDSVQFFRLSERTEEEEREIIRSQIVDFFTGSMSEPDSAVQGLIDTMQADATWADIDYASTRRASWPPGRHLDRLLEMSVAYADPNSVFYQDADLLAKILAGHQHWLDNLYYSLNWYNNRISVPLAMLRSFMMLGDDLPASMYSEARWSVLKDSAMDMTGTNQMNLARKTFLRSFLDNDPEMMATAIEEFWNVLAVTTEEGIQPDGSYHQHGPQQQFGTYGLIFSGAMVEWNEMLRGTSYVAPEGKNEILRNFLLNGEAWIVWNGVMDISALGREIKSGSQVYTWSKLSDQLERMKALDPNYIRAYETALMPTNGIVGHSVFWRSDFAVHRRPDWYSSVKMCSTRVVGTETANDENVSGIHLPDGALYVYQSGEEYQDIGGLWDWRRLPGTTCDQGMDNLEPVGYDKNYGSTDFVGGLTDGTNGVSVMIYKRRELSARKAWFFGEDSVTCLGSGIDGATDGSVLTSVQQSNLNGPVRCSSGSLGAGTNLLAAGEWVHHDGIGYHLLQPFTVHHGEVIGDWKQVNSTFDVGAVTGDVFSVWMNHGRSPVNEEYAYTIYPRAVAEEMDDRIANHGTVVLTNSTALQAIESGAGVFAVFYEAGQLTTVDGFVIETDTPCLVNWNAGVVRVAEPTQTHSALTLTVKGRPYDLILPDGGLAGSPIEFEQVSTPYIRTGSVSGIDMDRATLQADLAFSGDGDCSARIYWGTVDGGTGAWEYAAELGSVSTGLLSSVITGLEPGTEYWFRAWASNESGDSWANSSSSFITPDQPELASVGVTNVYAGSAVLSGSLSGGVADITLVWDTVDQGSTLSAWGARAVLSDQPIGEFSGLAGGLVRGNTYFARCFASNTAGQVWSDVISFEVAADAPSQVYVDFGSAGDTYSDVSEQYNNVSGSGSLAVVDTVGNDAGITLQYALYGGTYNYASGGDRAAVEGISSDVTTDRLYAGTGNFENVGDFGCTLTISGLNPANVCSLTVLPSPTGVSSTWTLATGTGAPDEYIQDSSTSTNVFEWVDILPDSSGKVVITGRAFSNSKWKSVGISGLIIQAVPASE